MDCMTRKLRHLDRADWYHVYNRGADGQDIFSLPGDRELFESLIAVACEMTGIEVHAYALMTNHFHFLIFDPEGNLAEFMRILCGRYALAYNSRTGRSGPLFTGRYGSVSITDDRHLLIEARYVERNPLALVPAAALASYRYASLGVSLGRRAGPEWLHTEILLPMMEGSDYLAFVLSAHESDVCEPLELPSARRATIADLRQTTFDICEIDIAEASGPVRNVALAVAFELRIADSKGLAGLLGVTAAGVRMAARRGRVLCGTDESMAGLKHRIIAALRH